MMQPEEHRYNVLHGKICPYCNWPSKLVHSSEIYGDAHDYGMMYKCSKGCDAYAGCHRNSTNALGRLADKTLRELKKKCHSMFDPLWKSGIYTRHEAYYWLSEQMGTHILETHIGMFDEDQCKKLISLL